MKYKKVVGIYIPTKIQYAFLSPVIAIKFIYYKIRKYDFKEYIERLRLIMELKSQVLYYSEKERVRHYNLICYYRQTKRSIDVKCRFKVKAVRKDYDNFRESVEIHGDISTPIDYTKGYAYFSVVMRYIAIKEYECTRLYVTVGTGSYGLVKWHWFSQPHGLIVGDTGEGKSTFMVYLLMGLFSFSHKIWCIDAKGVDYLDIESKFYNYIFYNQYDPNFDEVVILLEEFQSMMFSRYTDMRNKGIRDIKNHEEYEPQFFLIEEYLTFIKSLKKDQRERVEKLISNIVLLGRASGFFVLLTMQRADAKYLQSDVRDNFKFRMVLGNASDTSYEMIFGDSDLEGLEVGTAWYTLSNRIEMIKIPYYSDFERSPEGEIGSSEETSDVSSECVPKA